VISIWSPDFASAGMKVYNSALLLGPEGVAHVYRKLHLFNEEKRYFDAAIFRLQCMRCAA